MNSARREGLVTRGMCPDDRRGIYVHLTDAGRSRYAKALPTQRTVLAAEFVVPRTSPRGLAETRAQRVSGGRATTKVRTRTTKAR